MRFLATAILGLVLAAAPVMAQESSGNAIGHVFGSANCKPRYQCSDVSTMSFSDLNNDANACVLNFFGYSQPDGLFEDTGSLDQNNCMTAKPNVIPKGMGARLSPQCCIIQQDNGATCGFHCNLVTAQ
jgi:hypothetical protein